MYVESREYCQPLISLEIPLLKYAITSIVLISALLLIINCTYNCEIKIKIFAFSYLNTLGKICTLVTYQGNVAYITKKKASKKIVFLLMQMKEKLRIYGFIVKHYKKFSIFLLEVKMRLLRKGEKAK